MTGRRLALSVAIALFAAGSATAVSSQSTVYKPGDGVTLPVPIEEHRPNTPLRRSSKACKVPSSWTWWSVPPEMSATSR